MKAEEMKQGEIYFSNYDGYHWLSRFKKLEGSSVKTTNYMRKLLSLDEEIGGYWTFDATWGSKEWWEVGLREATPKEKQWFEACEQAGKFVEKPKELHYQIY